jgi:hypothetical protein
MCLQSIKSVKHNAAKSFNRSILKKGRHLGFGVFTVHSSMLLPMGGKITHPWTLLVTVGQEGGFPYTQTPPSTHNSYTKCMNFCSTSRYLRHRTDYSSFPQFLITIKTYTVLYYRLSEFQESSDIFNF